MPAELDDEIDGEVATPQIEGAAAAAILLMLLEENEAAAILKHFEPAEVMTLGRAMFAAAEASEAQIEVALDRFVSGSRAVSTFAVGADPRIRNVMNAALGNIRADNILARNRAAVERCRTRHIALDGGAKHRGDIGERTSASRRNHPLGADARSCRASA